MEKSNVTPLVKKEKDIEEKEINGTKNESNYTTNWESL